MVGDALCDILAVARSFNLHLMVACQHTGQLPDRLAESLMVNASVKLYFRSADRAVAASLGARSVPAVERLTLEPEPAKGDRPAPTVKTHHRIRDGYGTPLRLSDRSWGDFRKFAAQTGRPVETLVTLSPETYLFVHAADTGRPVPLASYVRGIPPEDLCIEGPALRLAVRFPRPKVRSAERPSDAEILKAHLKALAELPNRHCVADIQGRSAGIVKVADMPDPELDGAFLDYLDGVRRAGGQSPAEIAAVERRRTESIDAGTTAPAAYGGEEEISDGSL
jgi:hypothetical protein